MASWFDTGDMSVAQAVDIPPVWLVGFIALAGLPAWFAPSTVASFGIAKGIGAGLVAIGIGLMVWSIGTFRAHATSVVPHQTPKRMITDGPFALSRNPIYLGDVMVLAGLILWWGHWPALVLIPAFVIVITRRFIAPEESRLKENFGPEFDNYSQKTRRWL